MIRSATARGGRVRLPRPENQSEAAGVFGVEAASQIVGIFGQNVCGPPRGLPNHGTNINRNCVPHWNPASTGPRIGFISPGKQLKTAPGAIGLAPRALNEEFE